MQTSSKHHIIKSTSKLFHFGDINAFSPVLKAFTFIQNWVSKKQKVKCNKSKLNLLSRNEVKRETFESGVETQWMESETTKVKSTSNFISLEMITKPGHL